jgi:CheY-like chemotaxis protein
MSLDVPEIVGHRRRPTIVVMDDEPSLLACIAGILREENYRVLTSRSAAEALALAIAEDPDLMLLDVHMPQMSGLALLEALQKESRTRHIPVIFFSSAPERERARRLGAFDYIEKPAPADVLCERVFRGICVGFASRPAQRLPRSA